MSNTIQPDLNSTKSNKSRNCTTVGTAPLIHMPKVVLPKDLKIILKNKLKPTLFYTIKQQNYIACLKSLKNLKEIPEGYYLCILKLLLFIEGHELVTTMERNNLKEHTITHMSNENKNVFSIIVSTLNHDDPFVRVDDIIRIQEFQGRNGCFARIKSIQHNEILVSTPDKFSNQYDESKKYNIYFQYCNWPIRCCHYTIRLIHMYKIAKLMYPIVPDICVEPVSDIAFFNKDEQLNEIQKKAIIHILNRTAYPAPYILFGPPGTGKTKTTAALIHQIWLNSKRVLICTPSNQAADEIVERLVLYGIPCKTIYRMYSPSRSWSGIREHVKPCANFVDQEPIFLPKSIMLLKRIVVTTLITCVRLIPLKLRPNHFSYIIIDEASQATEPESLIPFTLTSGSDKGHTGKLQAQMVLVGDPFQLGPLVASPHIKHLLEISMLERLLKRNAYQKDENGKRNSHYITKLLNNYRSHPAILHTSNELFYENEIKACGGHNMYKFLGWSALPNKDFPLIFHDTKGQEEKLSNSESVYNTAEVSIVIEYLKKLMNKVKKLKQQDIAIITPYKAQEMKIQEKLTARKWHKISVGTVDAFQGQEKDVIILSTVRSKHIGFLSNEKRFNVAVTRAKGLLIVTGNSKVLDKDKCWRALIEYCRSHNAFITRFHDDVPSN